MLLLRAIFLSSMFSLLSNTCSAQINYIKLKKNQSFWQCGFQSKIDAENNLKSLDSIAQFDITKGKNQFLYDLGMANYTMFLFTKDTIYVAKSINAFKTCYEQAKYVDALHNLFICYGLVSDCDNQRRVANQLAQYAGKKKYSYLELNQPDALTILCK